MKTSNPRSARTGRGDVVAKRCTPRRYDTYVGSSPRLAADDYVLTLMGSDLSFNWKGGSGNRIRFSGSNLGNQRGKGFIGRTM